MKKKVIAILLTALLAGSIFTGCSAATNTPMKNVALDPQHPTTVTMWHYYSGAQKNAIDKLITEFNETVGKTQGIVVEGANQGSVDTLTENVLNSANKKVGAQDIPNLFTGYADTAYQIDKLGLVVNLEDYLSKEEIDEYVDSYVEEGRWGENSPLKILPTAKSTEVFMLNKTDWDKFSQSTGASMDALNTMEGLLDVSKEYYEWTDEQTPDVANDGKAFFGRDAMANYMIIGSKQLGSEIFSVKDGKVTYQVDKDIMRKLWDNYYVPYIHGYFASYGKFRSDDAKIGKILALVGSSTSANYFPTEITVGDTETYPIESLVLPVPNFKDGENYAVQQGAGVVVTKGTPQEEYASVEFLKWFTEKQRNQEFSMLSGYLPVKKEATTEESMTAILDQQPEGQIPESIKETLKVAAKIVNTSKLYTNKAFDGGTQARAVLNDSMQNQASEDRAKVTELLQQGKSLEEAVAQFDTDENFNQWYDSLVQALHAVKES